MTVLKVNRWSYDRKEIISVFSRPWLDRSTFSIQRGDGGTVEEHNWSLLEVNQAISVDGRTDTQTERPTFVATKNSTRLPVVTRGGYNNNNNNNNNKRSK